MRALLLATRSAGKLRELQPLLAQYDVALDTLSDVGFEETADEDALEVHATFAENALAKAHWFMSRSGGRVVIADDSGLVVDALGGAPGVRSKRWSQRPELSGEALDAANNAYLQTQLAAIGATEASTRRASYVCAAACVWPGGELVRLGETHGILLSEASGDGGFGYDPYFYSTELHAAFGAVSRDVKATVSHRARAFTSLIAAMRAVGVLHANSSS